MAAGPGLQVSDDFLVKQTDTALDLAEGETRQLELTSTKETSVLGSHNASTIQTTDPLDEPHVSATSTTLCTPSALTVKAISCSSKLKEDEVMPMEVDSSSAVDASSGEVESVLNHTNGDHNTMDDSTASSPTPNVQKQALLSSPTMVTPPGGYGFTKVEVMENSTKVDMDESSTNVAYPVYVSTLQEAEEVLHRFENNTRTRFCVWRCPKDFGSCKIDMKGKRIYWHEFIIEDRITVKSNGIPFVMMGRKVYDCHHGTDRNVALKHKARLKRQENDVKKRNVTTPSKKVGCPARIVFCEIIYFPQYKLETDTKHYRTVIAKTIRQHFADGKMDLENIERRIYLCFPSDKDHKGHPTGKFDSGLSQRVDLKVSNKISELISAGTRNEKEVLVYLDNYIARELFPGRAKPFHSNRRYYPSRGVVRLKIYNAYILKCLSLIDLEVVDEATRQWQNDNPEDKFHFRRYAGMDQSLLDGTTAIRVEDEHEDELRIRQKVAEEQLLFVHQTAFQRHLLKRYGNHTCFLDPVYRTVKYALPLYFLIVKTNVDYQVVASFVVQNESRVSIKEVLELLKSWNPDWKPKIVMVDNDSEEIASIEESFSGLFGAPVCHFSSTGRHVLYQPSHTFYQSREAVTYAIAMAWHSV